MRAPISVRVGVDTWVVGRPGALEIDGQTLNPPYTVVPLVIRRRWLRR